LQQFGNNCDLPRHLYGYVRGQFLRNLCDMDGGLRQCVIFGIESVPGRALSFHILLDNGALVSQVPIHALCHRSDLELQPRPLSELLRWDCFGWRVSAIEFAYLREVGFTVKSRSGAIDSGQYVCTIDFLDNGYSENPEQHKHFHLIALDDGNYTLATNDKCQAIERSFVEDPFNWDDPPKIQRNRLVWHAEE
jgi:hypothetical protein